MGVDTYYPQALQYRSNIPVWLMWIGYLVSYETISPKHIKPFTSNMVRDNKNSPLKSLAILLDIYTDNPYTSK